MNSISPAFAFLYPLARAYLARREDDAVPALKLAVAYRAKREIDPTLAVTLADQLAQLVIEVRRRAFRFRSKLNSSASSPSPSPPIFKGPHPTQSNGKTSVVLRAVSQVNSLPYLPDARASD